jgi:hypothetical protein
MMKLLHTLSILLLAAASQVQAQGWPREIMSSQGKIVIYQPQPQTLDGSKATGVGAFSITPKGKSDPVFGALFFDATLNVDRDSREYEVLSITIPSIKFSAVQEGIDLEKIKSAIIEEVPGWKIQGSLDELITTVEEFSDKASKGSEGFKNDAPNIIYRDKPSMLIYIDGEPRTKAIENSNLEYVMNSGYVIFRDKKTSKYYLYGGEIWYETTDIKGTWKTTKSVPKDITTLMEKNKDKAEGAQKVEVKAGDTPPAIVVATEPTELIQTNGPANYVPVKGSTNLLYAKNSEDNLFKEISSNNYYILKSGRWFSSQSLNGPWTFVPAEKIPEDFSIIEPGEEKDIIRASIPGTDEARDALLDAQLPQTATIDRKTGGKDIKVQYDGAPQFSQISGTSLQLAENADKTVMKSGSKYFLVENGAWYESSNYNGPWTVSTERPADVENIPASSPAYNTKYVHVYESTPDVVYVGYTPGYMGSYIYGPTVVYGTGWYYRPYFGSWYRPYHSTWGFNMSYNPWTGWGFGFGFSTGPFHFGFGTGGFSFGFGFGYGIGYPGYGWGGGWFGPPMYRPPCFRPSYPWYGYNRPGYRPGNRPGGSGGNINWGGGNQINIGGDVNININRPGGGTGGRPSARPTTLPNNNIYARDNKMGNKAVTTGMGKIDPGKIGARPAPGKPSTGQPATRPTVPDKSKLPNDVVADRDGNIYRKDKSGNWQQNSGGKWTNVDRQPTAPGANTRPAQPSNPGANTRPAQPSNPGANTRPAPTPNPGANTRPAPVPNPGPSARPSPRPTTPSGYNRPPNVNTSDYNRNRSYNRTNTYNRSSAPAARPAPRPAPSRRGG